MSTLVQKTCFLFGAVPPPVIEGFTFFSRPEHWLSATDGIRHYIVGARDSFWLLLEVTHANPLVVSLVHGDADRIIPKNQYNELAEP